MGWSCGMDAAHTMDDWTAACVKATGAQNTYTGTDGRSYFWEVSRKEHDDGAITGVTYQDLGDTCRASGSFRIAGNGEVVRYPKAWPFKPAGKEIRPGRVVETTTEDGRITGQVVKLGRGGVVSVKWDGYRDPFQIHKSALKVLY
jgi:hypothetical protein